MDAVSMINKIDNLYHNCDYYKTLILIEEYLCDKENGIFDWLFEMYINCQIKLGYFDDALNNVDLMSKAYPSYCSNFKLIILYTKCFQKDKADLLLEKQKLSIGEYYSVAKCFYYNGYYQDAKKIFTETLPSLTDATLINNAYDYLRKIDIYERKTEVFREADYSCFKGKGNVLEPGHIVFTNRFSQFNKKQIDNSDTKKYVRPYMIWKIEEDNIYAFPVVNASSCRNRYTLYCQKYPNSCFDRAVKDSLVTLKESSIKKVTDKVNEYDFSILLRNIYDVMCFSSNDRNEATQLFIDEMNSRLEICVNDILMIPSYDDHKLKHYFLLDIDNENQVYKTVELIKTEQNDIEADCSGVVLFSTKIPILNVKKIDNLEKDRILKGIGNLKEKMLCKQNEYKKH